MERVHETLLRGARPAPPRAVVRVQPLPVRRPLKLLVEPALSEDDEALVLVVDATLGHACLRARSIPTEPLPRVISGAKGRAKIPDPVTHMCRRGARRHL